METKDPALTKTRITDTNANTDTNSVPAHDNFEGTNHIESHTEQKGTKALLETVIGTRYVSDDAAHGDHNHDDIHHDNYNVMSSGDDIEDHTNVDKGAETFRESVVGSEYIDGDDINNRDTINNHKVDDKDIEDYTTVNKGTDTFKEGVVHSEHVNEGDESARQPDRRDQEGGTPFDEGINEDTVGSEEPKSEGINDVNRYATLDNAQSRILNPDEKD
ncbi:hypothetical protein [Psychrobacter frigidicola]|uniref:hypothetical protein n=1 Tax=Psychrobacter frigidicola TaxID=45611 RepID=UPI00191AEB8D|nr:hypothetical protein [Psychrobacter frigidicola]